jgi:hypothetical protein
MFLTFAWVMKLESELMVGVKLNLLEHDEHVQMDKGSRKPIDWLVSKGD